MFNPRPHRRLFAVTLSLFGRQVLFRLALVLVAGVARIGKNDLVVLAQQVGQFGDVGGIGRGHGDAVHAAILIMEN